MIPLLRSCVLSLAMACPALASAAAPTPQGIAEIQRLFGFDVFYDHVFNTKFGAMEEFKSLPPDQRTCFFGTLRTQFLDQMSADMATTFGDEQTVAAWIKFSATPGGTKMIQAMREMVTARVTGLPPPDMAAVEASLDPGEMVDVFVFQQSPAAEVMKREFPNVEVDHAAQVRQAGEGCGILPKKS